ncbi:glycosyltransferase [uncultured Erythrobacter sp.]|uniref:glycosyltransferase n=1 Tax=uncultured Erythrobacter sp. TaxID=263913 RepID=UPI00263A0413|nr:glycosyltransferase [uncultured Erythrobacter sp.]
MSNKLDLIHDFDNAHYLSENPDVASAVEAGLFSSGYEHYLIHGKAQSRTYSRTDDCVPLTVVVPCYNSERFLAATLLSIQLQSLKTWECIIVNDASDDRSTAIAAAFAKRDPRFRIAHHRANAGLSASRNLGIRLARGRYITFLDSDDILFQDSLRTRLEVIEASDPWSAAGSYCGSKHVPEDYADFPNSSPQTLRAIDFIVSEGKCPFTANQPMLNADLLRRFGGFREELRQAEDWELWMRLLRHGYNFIPTGYQSVGYRSRKGSMLLSEPLHHTTVSHAIYNSAHEALPEEWVIDGPGVFSQPWVYYRKQVQFADRLISAVGMAKEIDEEALAQLFKSAAPNFKQFVLDRVDTKEIIKRAMTRSLGLVGRHDDIIEIPSRRKLTDLLSRVPDDSGEPEDTPSISADNIFNLLGLSPKAAKSTDVLFAPHSAYHVKHMLKVAEELESRGATCVFVDSTSEYRNQGVRDELKRSQREFVSYTSLLLGRFAPKALVCMCDWDVPIQRVIKAAKHLGIPTVGIVEGVQDFDDVDTGRPRRAYKTVDHVLLPGKFDEKHFSQDLGGTQVVGLARLDELRTLDRKEQDDQTVIINVNFTYNVLEDRREDWLEEVVQACEELGVRYTISQHPSDTANLDMYERSEEPLYELLKTGSCLVSRFSSVILESLAIGTPVVYHNSIEERVDKFSEPLDAYEKSETVEELKEAISKSLSLDQDAVRKQAKAFLDLHCGFDSSKPSTVLTADAIQSIVEDHGSSHSDLTIAEILRSSDHFAPYNVSSADQMSVPEQDMAFAEANRKIALQALAKSSHKGVSKGDLRKLIVSASAGASDTSPSIREPDSSFLSQANIIGGLKRGSQTAQVEVPVWRGFSDSSFVNYPTYEDAGKGSSFFFSGWLNFAEAAVHQCVMGSAAHSDDQAKVMVRRHSNGKVQFHLSHQDASDYVWHELPHNTWFWVAGLFDGPRLEMWVNGTLVQQRETQLALGDSSLCTTLNVGVFTDSRGKLRDPMRGAIALLEVSGRAHSAQEIENKYAKQRHYATVLSEGSFS